MSDRRSLILLPNLRARRTAERRVVLTRKFVEGMDAFVRGWDGPVLALMEPRDEATDNLDEVAVDPRELDFEVDVLSYDAPELGPRLAQGAVVLGGLGYRQNHVARLARAVGTPLVYGAEYTLKTRIQIARANGDGMLPTTRRIAWEWRQERAQRAALSRASGLQCNGTPTFEEYADWAPRPLLFFDSRTTADLLATLEEQRERAARLRSGEPLHLAFSGRLNRMKGADHLVPLAAELRKRGVAFRFTIFGDGELLESMRAEVAHLGLNDLVELPGSVDYRTELVPRVRREVDLFVCAHRQGDPSCTYVETLACGVPIAGYANEALAGILRRVEVGTAVALNDARALADELERLATRDRERLVAWSDRALSFAERHTFAATFAERIAHLERVVEETSAKAGRRPQVSA